MSSTALRSCWRRLRLTFEKVSKVSVAASCAYRMDAALGPVTPAEMTGRCAGIERGDESCCQEGGIDGGGEGEAQVAEGAAAEVGGDGRRVGVQELMHGV